MATPRTLLLNSATAFVLAGMLAITLHEGAHLVTALGLGHHAVLYPSAVDFHASSRAHRVATALAGPLFSLVSGLALVLIGSGWGRGFGRLFWLWLGFLSAQIGFGYLIIAPFARAGDTGQALALLSAPGLVYAVSFAVGMAGMYWLARRFAGEAIRYASEPTSLRAIGLFSWLLGTGILLVVYVPANRHLSGDAIPTVLAGVGTIGIFTPLLTFFYRRLEARREELVLSTPFLGIAGAAVLAAVLVGVVAPGLSFG